jgi:signal transduction histidine kinase
VLILRWFLDNTRVQQLAIDHDISRKIACRYLHEGIDVLAAHAPDLHHTLDSAKNAGLTHINLDAQRRFIANASHELRTPLAINRTVLEVSLEEPEASPDLKALARALLGTNARYERLIEGLLLLAQSEQELTSRKPLELDQVVRAALDQLDLQPRKRPVTIHQDLSSVTVEGDPLFLERAIFNLVENAIKYNMRDGDVWVSCGKDGLVVENTGPLVPPYEVEDIFEPFRRLQGDRVRSARGAGLGLSIVRAIVDAHGGTVTATSRSEGGLRVTVCLPYPSTPMADSGGDRLAHPDVRTPDDRTP